MSLHVCICATLTMSKNGDSLNWRIPSEYSEARASCLVHHKLRIPTLHHYHTIYDSKKTLNLTCKISYVLCRSIFWSRKTANSRLLKSKKGHQLIIIVRDYTCNANVELLVNAINMHACHTCDDCRTASAAYDILCLSLAVFGLSVIKRAMNTKQSSTSFDVIYIYIFFTFIKNKYSNRTIKYLVT